MWYLFENDTREIIYKTERRHRKQKGKKRKGQIGFYRYHNTINKIDEQGPSV